MALATTRRLSEITKIKKKEHHLIMSQISLAPIFTIKNN